MHYGQFCPVAKTSESVAERWTPLVIAELLAGSTRFSDIRRGVPLMSQTLLSTRLKELVRVGIVERRGDNGRAHEWHLTEAGAALGPVIQQLGEWGLRYAQDPLGPGDLDVTGLVWCGDRGRNGGTARGRGCARTGDVPIGSHGQRVNPGSRVRAGLTGS